MPMAGDSHRYPEFIGEGNQFLFVWQSGKPDTAGTYVASLDGGAPVRILPDNSHAIYVPPFSAEVRARCCLPHLWGCHSISTKPGQLGRLCL